MIPLQQFAAVSQAGRETVSAVNWDNIGPGTSPQVNAAQTLQGFSGTLTLRATLSSGTYGAGAKAFRVYLGGVLQSGVTPSDGQTLDLSITSGNQVNYQATKGTSDSWNATATVSIVETGQILDTFTVSVDA